MRHHGAESFPEGFGCETDHLGAACELFALFKILPVQADHIAAGDLIGLGCKVHHSNPCPLCGRIENVIEWDWRKLSIDDRDHRPRASSDQKLRGPAA